MELNPSGGFTGIASGVGMIDRSGDVLAPRAFENSIEPFLKSGFITIAHEWSALPVAMPTGLRVKGTQLILEAQWHSTVAGQEARSVVRERLANGLTVGLSIGFRVLESGTRSFTSGAALLRSQPTPRGFDTAPILAWSGRCRLIETVAELFEVSIVAVPMNPAAQVQSAKGLPFFQRAPAPLNPNQPDRGEEKY